ncbi:MAG: Gfo/Idh/MocA family protein [Planctomycetota bacterium]|jgi:predicted dehydrogenase
MSKLRVAFLGCGGIAGKHTKSLKGKDEIEIVGGSDVTEEQVNKFFERTLEGYEPGPGVFTDAAKMYAGTKPDAVVICTPHTLHYDQGMQALDAGLHVLMEKPMVTNAGHARELKAKVDETGKVFVIGYNTPCSPNFKYLRDRIREGTFGKLELVNGYLSQNWKKGTAGKWRQDPALSGGGQAYDSGAHLMNSLCWSVESDVEEVFAFVDNHGTAVDINSVTSVRFASGVMANITVSGNSPGNGSYMVFVFDGGRIEIDGWGGGWIKVFGADGKQIEEPKIEGEAMAPAENFIDAILGRDEARTTPQNGIVQSDLMDAIYESAKTGKPARPA